MSVFKNFYVDTTKGLDVINVMHEVRRVIAEAGAEGGSVTVAIPNAGAGFLILDQADGRDTAKKALEPLIATKQIQYILPKTMTLPIEKGKMPIELRQDLVLVDYETSAKRREFCVQVAAQAAPSPQGGQPQGIPLGRIG